MFQSPLICTDFTDGLDRLVKFVSSLAQGGVRQIVFLHAVPVWEEGDIPRVDTVKIEQARDRLLSNLEQDVPSVDVKIEVQCGRPIDSILKTAKVHQNDVILLGSPNRSLLSETLFGSTTVGLAKRANLPLMILRPQLISTFTDEELALRCQHLYHTLLIPYDGSTPAKLLVQQVQQQMQLSANQLERCILCWVIDAARRNVPKEPEIQRAQSTLQAVQAEFAALKIPVDLEVREGDAVTQVLEVAQSGNVSAIAITSGTLGRLMEWSVPSFAGEILRRSWHPVLFFPPIR